MLSCIFVVIHIHIYCTKRMGLVYIFICVCALHMFSINVQWIWRSVNSYFHLETSKIQFSSQPQLYMRRIIPTFYLNMRILFSINTLIVKIFNRGSFMEKYEFPPSINLEFAKEPFIGTVQQLENQISSVKEELILNIHNRERITRMRGILNYYERTGRKYR